MRIRVDFTLDVPEEYVAALIELAAADDLASARRFVKAEAEENLYQYLENNGVWPVPVRSVARPNGGAR